MAMSQAEQPKPRTLLAHIFVSPFERRLRAGWRLLIQAVLQIFLSVAGVLAVELVIGGRQVLATDASSPGGLLAAEIIDVGAVTGSVFLARRLLDRRSLGSLGLGVGGKMLPDILAGIGIAIAIMGLIFGAEWAMGWLTLAGFAWSTQAAPDLLVNSLMWFAAFILVGWNEELLSRGYHLQTIASGMGLLWGLLISSAIFGLLHLGNPNATWVSAAGIFFAGLFLSYAYVRTGRLWLSIGLHIGWNFAEGVLFGFPVSGLDVYHLTRISVHGPVLWTGGAFGPEAGLLVIPAVAVGAGLIHIFTRRREGMR